MLSGRWTCLLAFASALAGCTPDPAPVPDEGGRIIYIRHARTEMRIEPTVEDLSDCSWQRNLNADGRAQSLDLGDEIRKLGMRIETVLSSGFCRAKQTAELAFGRLELWSPLTYHASQTPQQHRDNVAAIRDRLGQPVPPGTLLVMVAHEPGLRDSLGITLAEGEAAILQPLPNGEVRLIRRLKPSR